MTIIKSPLTTVLIASFCGFLSLAHAEDEPGYQAGNGSAAVGPGDVAVGINNLADSTHINSSGAFAAAFGAENLASNLDATAVGFNNMATGINSTALGTSNIASADGSLAVGFGTSASAEHTVAIGTNSQVTSAYSVAIGYNATSTAESSVALGDGTIADEEYTVAVGGRRITDIGEPLSPTDAVNLARVHALESKLEVALEEIAELREAVERLSRRPPFIPPGHQ